MARPENVRRAVVSRDKSTGGVMTGRYIVTLKRTALPEMSERMEQLLDTPLAARPAYAPHATKAIGTLPRGQAHLFEQIGVVLVDAFPRQEDALLDFATREDNVLAVEPERMVRALGAPVTVQPMTWGLTAAKVNDSPFSGVGIKVAILDTGLDLSHPDFQGRTIVTCNFVGDGKPFHDGLGHGTHCTGTACGPTLPSTSQRYGIAWNSLIYSGRVLDDNGDGGDANVLAGIDWAIAQGCTVISMSLGTPWTAGDPPFSVAYETAAGHALAAGCILVVAAGNEADDSHYVGAVATPGNTPSAIAVAALETSLATAPFSDRATPKAPNVKAPDIAAPGVDIYSAWPGASYKTCLGTSNAAPHVAGIAALYAEKYPAVRGQALKDLILQNAMRLQDSEQRKGEIGHGLVQAPAGSATI